MSSDSSFRASKETHELSDLVALTQLRARESGEATAYVFLEGGEREAARLTYAELDLQARSVAARLVHQGSPGDRLLLVYPAGLDFIVAFLACLYAQRVPVPVAPPGRRQRDRRLSTLIEDCGARQVLHCSSLRTAVEAQLSGMSPGPELIAHPTDLPRDTPWSPAGAPGDIAFLQYTSGSTGHPKGVMVSHRNLIHHWESLRRLDDGQDDRVMVSWLPMFHDMGLIWGALYPLYEGFPAYLMAPVAFLQQPYRWLAAISRYRGTHSAGPDSAYRLCSRRVTEAQRATLDLSCWRYAMNGAETVRGRTLLSFQDTFAACGFPEGSLLPCYGLAESTLRVTQRLPGTGYCSAIPTPPPPSGDGQWFRKVPNLIAEGRISAGTAPAGLSLRIVDPETRQVLPEGREGEIWTTSPWLTHGYWNRPPETERTFRAYTADGQGPLLRTGDLGVLIEDELFVTGRIKEMLILRGTNYHPHDLEATLERAHPAIAPSSGAVFAVEHEDEERLVAIFEIARQARHGLDTEDVLDALSQSLALEWGLDALALVLLRPAGMPRTSSGKIQRLQCRDRFLADDLPVMAQRRRGTSTTGDSNGEAPSAPGLDTAQADSGAEPGRPERPEPEVQEIRRGLLERLATHLGCPVEQLDPDQPFARYGLDSAAAVGLSGELESWLKRRLPATLLYDYPTVSRLARFLAEESNPAPRDVPRAEPRGRSAAGGCAVLGMACRFPGAENPAAFWQLVRNAEVVIRRNDRAQLEDSEHPVFAGLLDQDPAAFDPDFFGIAPREANSMDPQQRLLLEVAYEALGNAGLPVRGLAGSKTGVFVGIGSYDYALAQFAESDGDAYAGTGNSSSIAANRLSYTWDLRGPSLAVDTACSSSLAAVHLACQSLRAGDCDLAIVGAVHLLLASQPNNILRRAGMLADDGRCTPFDDAAGGYVRGEGCGVLILSRLDRFTGAANAVGGLPLALLRGTALGQDGRSNGLTAPSGPSQQAAVRAALEDAGLSAADIDYVEAHGTGTPLGDPIELDALGSVFGGERHHPLWVSSVKANIGHLEAAAGMAGLIKTILALQHGEIPPQAAFENPSSRIPWQTLPVTIPRQPAPWPTRQDRPRRAGVSSFGFGGTNAHLVVEQAPPTPPGGETDEPRPLSLLTLSAHDRPALHTLARRYRDYLLEHPRMDVRDVCAQANRGYDALNERLAVVGRHSQELCEGLDHILDTPEDEALGGMVFRATVRTTADSDRSGPVFLCSGQGNALTAVGRILYRDAGVFRDLLEACDRYLAPELGCNLPDLLWGSERQRLETTQYMQPALFALQVAYAGQWAAWGVEPSALVGHSSGEVAAAHLAGVFDLADACRLISARGRLMQTLSPQGGMLSVFAAADDIARHLESLPWDISIAAYNGPRHVVLAGATQDVESLESWLRERSIRSRRLETRHAFHSPAMGAAAEALEAVVRTLTLQPPGRPLVSTLSGSVAAHEVATADYWRRQMLAPVRFEQAVETLGQLKLDCCVEIGPAGHLLAMARRCPSERERHWIPSAGSGADDWTALLVGLSRLYVGGHADSPGIHWHAFERGRPRSVHYLPNYPFARRDLWFTAGHRPRRQRPEHPLLGDPRPLADPPGAWVWIEDQAAPRFMEDHQIEGSIVFGGTAFLEMALAAGRARGLGEVPELIDLDLEQALIYDPDQPQQLQTFVMPDDDGARLTIHGRGAADQPWRRLVRGRIKASEGSSLEGDAPSTDLTDGRLALVAIQGRSAEVSATDFYAAWAQRGNAWGPRYQGIQQLWCGDQEALAFIDVPAALGAELESSENRPFLVHPALLDACVQALAAVVPASRPGAIVGRRVERFRLLRPHNGGPLWSHARLRPDADGPGVVGDLWVADDEGRVLGRAEGVHLGLLQRGEANTVDPLRWLHSIQWVSVDVPTAVPTDVPPETTPSHPSTSVGTWLLDGDDALIAPLRRRLEAHGATVLTTAPTTGNGQELDGPLRGIVHCSPPGQPPTDATQNVGDAFLERLEAVLRLVKQVVEGPPGPLWIVTRGAWTLADGMAEEGVQEADGGSTDDARGATLWGLGRSLASEHPDRWGGLVDLDPTGDVDQRARLLADFLLSPGGEDQVLLRSDGRFVPRLERLRAPDAEPLRLRSDASYLITGGLGGLGLLLADWLVSQGARRLVLMGRSPLPPRSTWNHLDPASRDGRRTAAVRGLEHRGASVILPVVDVADGSALTDWLSSFESEGWPSIRGVLHAAGAATATPLRSLDRQTLEATLGGKAFGATTLDRWFGESLDFFVLCSSASGILNSPGLAAYAAANTYLDALAMARRARGRHALSFQWGAWSDVGLAAEGFGEGEQNAQTADSVTAIDPATGLQLVERCWGLARDSVAFLPIDWDLWQTQYPSAARAPLFERVIAAVSDEGAHGLREQLDEADAATRCTLLADWLRRRLATVLLTTPEAIDPGQPLNRLGLDSLMGLELRHQLDRQLGVSISMVELLRGASLDELVTQVLSLLSDDVHRVAGPVAGPVNEGIPLPLSHQQAAQLLLHELAPESAAYHVAFAARIHSPITVPTLENALSALVARHPSLRTSYSTTGGRPTQTVQPRSTAGFTIHRGPGHDLQSSEQTASWSEQDVSTAIRKAYGRPFDLHTGPLLRADLFTLADDHHVLLLCAHHVSCDGWSLWLLLAELGEIYAAEAAGSAPELDAVELRYTDFTTWQHDLLDGPEGERLRTFWEGRLTPPPPALDLPFDRPRPATQSLDGASHDFWLDRPLAEAIEELARGRGATPYALLLTAFQALLHRLTGQLDIAVGCPATGRTQSGLEGVVGNFVNPVVVRTQIDPGDSCRALLDTTKGHLLDALAAQDYPFPRLVQDLKPPRDASRSPLFQVNFLYQQPQTGAEILELVIPEPNMAQSERRTVPWGGLPMAPYDMPQQEGQLDLTLEVIETPAGLYSVLKYARDLFDATTIERLAGHFETLLRGIVDRPETAIRHLPLLNGSERQQIETWSQGPPAAADGCLHTWVERRAAEAPDAPAVCCGDQRLSRGQLEARANQFAHHLLALGLQRESRVGIFLERSIDMVAALLAVSKIGAAWVPMDPTYPAKRLAHIAGHAGLDLLLSDQTLAEKAPVEDVPCCRIDAESEVINGRPTHAPAIDVPPAGLAYVIYTSGSTGLPKGVAIEQRALVNLLESMRHEPGFSADDRLLALTTLAFDIAALELFLPLVAGGQLVLAERADSLDPRRLIRLIERHGVTVLQATPATWQLLLASDIEGLPQLRVLSGGEALHRQLAAQLQAVSREVWNVYGPTETTVWSGVHRVGGEPPELATVPIGKPILGTSFRILDAALQPVPVGVAGDLYIGGRGLARGYWRSPALTAENYVPDPWSQHPGARLYRTGDRAHWRPEGDVVFLGRSDHQVKIRGFRIEPGEIEAVLCGLPDVDEAAVVVRQDQRGDPHLVAYVVAARGSADDGFGDDGFGDDGSGEDRLSAPTLRSALRSHVPEYMVPAAYEVLPTLPRTDNGKIDRRALPTPAILLGETPRHHEFVAPSGSREQIIAEVWSAVLGLEKVGRHDNFFDLGGHSLLLVETHRQLSRRLGDGLEVMHLFEYPSIAGLAAFLGQTRDSTHDLAETEARAGQQRAALAMAQRRARQRRRHGSERI